jgi:YVTN family beta-propeller protein
MKNNLIGLLAALILLGACKSDNNEFEISGEYAKGVFIVNEGPFQNGTGTLSFYDRQKKTVTHDIFATANTRPLGNIVQSMEVFTNQAYMVVNNAGKVEIADAGTLKSTGVITGLKMPRYFLGISSEKALVSEWGDNGVNGAVKIVNLNTKQVTATIPTGKGAERMVKIDNTVWVANSGGFSTDNTVSIIDLATEKETAKITVADNPSGIVHDLNGRVWVLCKGRKVYNADWSINAAASTAPALVRINSATRAVDFRLDFPSKTASAGNLTCNGNRTTLYFSYGGKVYAMANTATALPANALINRSFYGLGYDPTENLIYGADAGNFSAQGKVIRYNTSGVAVDSVQAGIVPNGFCFR